MKQNQNTTIALLGLRDQEENDDDFPFKQEHLDMIEKDDLLRLIYKKDCIPSVTSLCGDVIQIRFLYTNWIYIIEQLVSEYLVYGKVISNEL